MGVKRNSGPLECGERTNIAGHEAGKIRFTKMHEVARDTGSDIADHVAYPGYMTTQYMPHVATTSRRSLIASMTDSGGSAVKGVAASSSQGRGLERSWEAIPVYLAKSRHKEP